MRSIMLIALAACSSNNLGLSVPPRDLAFPPADLALPPIGTPCLRTPTVLPLARIVGNRPDDLFAIPNYNYAQEVKLLNSSDQFATQIPVNAPEQLTDIAVSAAGTLIAIDVGGGVRRSADRGSTWSAPLPTKGFVFNLRAFPDGPIYATATGGIAVSRDDGQHWSPLPIAPRLTVTDVYAVGNDIFVAVGVPVDMTLNGGVAHSSDGGTTWSIQLLPGTSVSSSISGSSLDDLWVVGQDLAVGEAAHHSHDRGTTWTPSTVGAADPLFDVRGSAQRVHTSASDTRRSFASDDHGATWTVECQYDVGCNPLRMWVDPGGGALLPALCNSVYRLY
jgi:hypothetical protein